jgi:hypothetical protein
MTPSEHIDKLIAETTDWRGDTLASVRKAILKADPEIVEEWKWMGSPVWYRDGIIVVGNAHKKHVKLTFANGAHIADPDKLFNNGLAGNKWRSIDFFEGDKVNAPALTNLIRAAIEYNQSKSKKKTTTATPAGAAAGTRAKAPAGSRAKAATGSRAKASTGARAKAAAGTQAKATKSKKT